MEISCREWLILPRTYLFRMWEKRWPSKPQYQECGTIQNKESIYIEDAYVPFIQCDTPAIIKFDGFENGKIMFIDNMSEDEYENYIGIPENTEFCFETKLMRNEIFFIDWIISFYTKTLGVDSYMPCGWYIDDMGIEIRKFNRSKTMDRYYGERLEKIAIWKDKMDYEVAMNRPEFLLQEAL
jgi:hypothetical protein